MLNQIHKVVLLGLNHVKDSILLLVKTVQTSPIPLRTDFALAFLFPKDMLEEKFSRREKTGIILFNSSGSLPLKNWDITRPT